MLGSSTKLNIMYAETRSITEPAGALSLAGLKRYIIDNGLLGAQKRFVAVVSGANMNFDRLRFVSERAEVGEGREVLLSVEIPETPGRQVRWLLDSRMSADGMTSSFIALHTILHPRAVTEFSYRYNSPSIAHIFLSFILASDNRTKEVEDVLSALDAKGMKGFDISDNELAKSHARYMVGGRSNVDNERIFRFGEWIPIRRNEGLNGSTLSVTQHFPSDRVHFANSCWDFRQVGMSPYSIIVIMALVSPMVVCLCKDTIR